MKFLDRFKNKKEQEIKAGSSAPASTSQKDEKQTVKKTDKKPAAKKTTDKKPASKPSAGSNKKFRTETVKVILSPVISEKAAHLADMNQYVFRVESSSNRVQVRQAFVDLYGVQPSRINIVNVPGKSVRFGRRTGRRSGWKKAIITVPKGSSIQVYEGV